MKTLILIHGRSWKPPEEQLKKMWVEAIRFGIQRDFPDKVALFDQAHVEFVYFGDISNHFLSELKGKPAPDDLDGRKETLALLKQWRAGQFNKRNYRRLPGKESFKEGVADILSPLLSYFHLSDELISQFAPDLKEYWKGEESAFGSAVREPLTRPLMEALDRQDSVCLLGHSLGSMIAYDVLWKFSYRGEYRPSYCNKMVDLFLTIGSPLGDATVKKGLLGAHVTNHRQYPCNIRKWINVAAEDDYISHDERIRNDYRKMIRLGLVDSIKDYKIYNLALREGKSNPHHSCGYLIHPRVSQVLVSWLGDR